jgi:hypothetical protein
MQMWSVVQQQFGKGIDILSDGGVLIDRVVSATDHPLSTRSILLMTSCVLFIAEFCVGLTEKCPQHEQQRSQCPLFLS